MNTVKIERKVLGNGLSTILVTMNGQEGMLLPELAKVLNVGRDTLSDHIKRHNLSFVSPTRQTQQELRKQNVIKLSGRSPNFLPRATVEALVKLVGTPEAWAIYGQLWEVARAVHAGDFAQAGGAVDISLEGMIRYSQIMTAALQEQGARADRAEAKIAQITKTAATHALTHALTAAQILERYPDKVGPFIAKGKARIPPMYRATYKDAGFLSLGLEASGVVTTVNKTYPHGSAKLYDVASIEELFK